jgi:hypothetical protein
MKMGQSRDRTWKINFGSRASCEAVKAWRARTLHPRGGTSSARGIPPAIAKEGGPGASVRSIGSADNRGAGASMGNQLKQYADGAQVAIKSAVEHPVLRISCDRVQTN